MANDKNKKDKLVDIINKDILSECPRTIPKPAKYKKTVKSDKSQPDIEINKKVVVRVGSVGSKGNIEGYLLGVIVDYMENKGWWCNRTELILYIINNTNNKLDKYLGRLIHATFQPNNLSYVFSDMGVNSFDPRGYKWTKKLSFGDFFAKK